MNGQIVAQRFDLQRGEALIDGLDFLQANDVRLFVLQPTGQMLDTLAHRIHVPGRD
jgi:hypothetical protein